LEVTAYISLGRKGRKKERIGGRERKGRKLGKMTKRRKEVKIQEQERRKRKRDLR